jgi:hypothetical protein
VIDWSGLWSFIVQAGLPAALLAILIVLLAKGDLRWKRDVDESRVNLERVLEERTRERDEWRSRFEATIEAFQGFQAAARRERSEDNRLTADLVERALRHHAVVVGLPIPDEAPAILVERAEAVIGASDEA